ncbi:MAG: M28 family peptidase [Bacteroidetes bacterium]|nr:M28 family peptidase [Bacteroidota bacterium]
MKKFLLVSFSIVIVITLSAYALIKQPIISKENNIEKIYVDSLQLKKHVAFLSEIQPARNYTHVSSLNICANYIKNYLSPFADTVYFQEFRVDGNIYKNVIASYGTKHSKRLIVGAHYDSCEELPGADDNASGVAGLLELGKLLHGKNLNKRIDLVAYTLEEPPFFRTENMGSAVHANSLLADSADIIGMLCLEMIGYYSDAKKSQEYPASILKAAYPTVGNYVVVVGKLGDDGFTRSIKKLMIQGSEIPVESINAPAALPGIDFSDHLNYWKYNFKAVMIGNTGFYRNKNYHTAKDTKEKLNYTKMSQVVASVYNVVLNID